jgi:hypothetical protein
MMGAERVDGHEGRGELTAYRAATHLRGQVKGDPAQSPSFRVDARSVWRGRCRKRPRLCSRAAEAISLRHTVVVLPRARVRSRSSNRAASDIQQATGLARRYVSQWGLSDEIGPILVGDNEQELFLGRELQTRREVSERTAQLVDSEVSRVIKEAYARATAVLIENMDLLHVVAAALLDRRR